MQNPLISLSDLIGKEIKIIPATGEAVEELPHPDQDEIEDIIINKGREVITAFAEEPEPNPKEIYRSTPPSPQLEVQNE